MQWSEWTAAALTAAQLESGQLGCCLALLGGLQLLVSTAWADLYVAFAYTMLLHSLGACCPAFWIVGAGEQRGPGIAWQPCWIEVNQLWVADPPFLLAGVASSRAGALLLAHSQLCC